MKKVIMALLLVLVISAVSLALFGYAEAGDNSANAGVTILAKVEDLGDTEIYIRGLAEDFGGNYVFDIDGVMFCREGEEHIAADIQIGDIISVTFNGMVTKDIPGTLKGVTKVVRMNG